MIAPTKPPIPITPPTVPPKTNPAGCYPERSTQAGKLGTFSSIADGLPRPTRNDPNPFLFYPPMALDQTNEQRLAFGAEKVFLDNAQGTGNWTTDVPLPGVSGLVSALNYVNDNLIYAATHLGEVYRLVNSGGWTATAIHAAPLPPDVWIWDMMVSPSDPNVITAALGGFGTGHVWRGIVNAAGTAAVWSNLSGTGLNVLPGAPVNAIALDTANPTHLFAGTDVGVFRTLDDGVNWIAWREGCPTLRCTTSGSTLRRGCCARPRMAAACGSAISTPPPAPTP